LHQDCGAKEQSHAASRENLYRIPSCGSHPILHCADFAHFERALLAACKVLLSSSLLLYLAVRRIPQFLNRSEMPASSGSHNQRAAPCEHQRVALEPLLRYIRKHSRLRLRE